MSHKSVAKGIIYLGITRLLFLASGYVIHLGLGRLLGPELYGTYSVVISLITMINLVLTTGIPSAASKFVSERPDMAQSILKTSAKLLFYLSLFTFATYFISANFVAELLRDRTLTPLIRLSSIIIPIYAFFRLYLSYLNGLQDYRNQSIVSIVYYLSKIGFVFGFVFLGYSVYGAVFGISISPIVGLFVAITIAGIPQGVAKYENYTRIIRFALPIILLSLALNFAISIDLLALKAIIRNPQEIGYYSAASMISKVPLVLLGALNMALFPAISSVTYLNNLKKSRRYIYEGFRYVLIILIPISVFVSITAPEFVSLLYSYKYTMASKPLRILIIGILFFSVFSYLLNIVVASGKPITALYFSIFLLVLSSILSIFLIYFYRMVGAAMAVTLASLISMTILLLYIIHNFGSVVPWATLIKAVLSSLLITPILYIRVSGIQLIVLYLTSFFLYLALLGVLGEIKEKDITRLRNAIYLH